MKGVVFQNRNEYRDFVKKYYFDSVSGWDKQDISILMSIQSHPLRAHSNGFKTYWSEYDSRCIEKYREYMQRVLELPFDCIFYRGGVIPDAHFSPFVSVSALKCIAREFGRVNTIKVKRGARIIPTFALNSAVDIYGDPESEIIIATENLSRRWLNAYVYE